MTFSTKKNPSKFPTNNFLQKIPPKMSSKNIYQKFPEKLSTQTFLPKFSIQNLPPKFSIKNFHQKFSIHNFPLKTSLRQKLPTSIMTAWSIIGANGHLWDIFQSKKSLAIKMHCIKREKLISDHFWQALSHSAPQPILT